MGRWLVVVFRRTNAVTVKKKYLDVRKAEWDPGVFKHLPLGGSCGRVEKGVGWI